MEKRETKKHKGPNGTQTTVIPLPALETVMANTATAGLLHRRSQNPPCASWRCPGMRMSWQDMG